METFIQATVGVAALAIAGIFFWSVMAGMRKGLHDDVPLPMFAMLERQGLTLRQVEEAVGLNELALAARRCAFCSSRADCTADPVWCPNEPILRRAKRMGAP